MISMTDQYVARELVARIENGEPVTDEELGFLAEMVEEQEDDLVEALHPRVRA